MNFHENTELYTTGLLILLEELKKECNIPNGCDVVMTERGLEMEPKK